MLLAHSLLSRFYFENKLIQSPYVYAIERELHRFCEPSQGSITKEPEHLPELIKTLTKYFNEQCNASEVYSAIYKPIESSMHPVIRLVTVDGPTQYVLYIDMMHDTFDYILSRLEYYTGIPKKYITLTSNGVYVTDGSLFQYVCVPYLKYSLVVPPSRIDLSPLPEGITVDPEEPRTPSLLVDYDKFN